jgi:NAD(P)-dependent dehydrogenase (short-subunit alcohol dehydrogenase family)
MKTVIVTGAAGNLGKAVAEKFILQGYRVIGTVTKKQQEDIFTSDQFEAYVVNLANENETLEFAEKVIAKYSTIDTAVLTVGGFAAGNIADTPVSDIVQQFNLNFVTAYTLIRPVFEQMLLQKTGKIFLTGSKAGLSSTDSKGMVAYGLAKSLLFRLAELMNDEATGTNIVTTVVVPSTIDTKQNRQSMPDADFTKWVTPEAIADIIYNYTTSNAPILKEPVLKVYNNA